MAIAARKLESDYVYTHSSTMRVYTHRTAVPVQEQAPTPAPAVHTAVKAATKPDILKKLLTTCAILASAAAILLVMVRYAVITEQYALVNEYRETIEENKRMLTELEVKLNSAVSLEDAREAALAAGLGYPAASQIVHINSAGTVSPQ